MVVAFEFLAVSYSHSLIPWYFAYLASNKNAGAKDAVERFHQCGLPGVRSFGGVLPTANRLDLMTVDHSRCH